CSGFTRVTARPVAQPPKAAFVTRLRRRKLPGCAARQLPDRSTPIWVGSSPTGDPCPRGTRQRSATVLQLSHKDDPPCPPREPWWARRGGCHDQTDTPWPTIAHPTGPGKSQQSHGSCLKCVSDCRI